MEPLLQLLAGECYTPPPSEGVVHTQLIDLPADVPTDCSDINMLFTAMNHSVAQCCLGGICNGGLPTTCSLRCAAALVPLVDGCGTVFRQLLPAHSFQALQDTRNRCLARLTTVRVTTLRLPNARLSLFRST